ncbi:MAG: hypothetical protein K2L78_02895, partial [Muribaculaceae bacterium]|nr:hypothetical protein [Muribaculaceae bacterium]
MKKSLLTMALAACMAVPGIVASPATTSAVAPRRSVDTPAHVAMKSHAATEAVARMPKARALASPNGFYCDVAIPSVRKAAANASAELPELYGSVIYADGWTTQANEIGMYRIGTSDAVPFERMGTARVDATAGGVAVGDTYWASYMVDIYGSYFAYTQKFDLGTWVEDTSYDFRSSMQIMSTGVAYDRSTGNIYGCFYDDDARGYVFGTVDYVVKKRTAIKKLERMWSAVAVTRKGQLYAIDDTGVLYSVDKSTGDMTPVGDTGLLATNPSSACIDPRSGRCFYAVVQGSDGSLYEIDLNTAQATLIYHFPKNQEVVGMFVPMPDADDNAPDAVTDLRLDFTKGSLSGTVSFTAPATTFDGTPAEGSLNYVVEANDITMASGTTAYGRSVDAPIAFSAPGNYTFKVYVSNSVGNGPAAEASMFVGNDLPLAPELTATMDDGVVTLSWEPVASSANGGYIDVENLTYK